MIISPNFYERVSKKNKREFNYREVDDDVAKLCLKAVNDDSDLIERLQKLSVRDIVSVSPRIIRKSAGRDEHGSLLAAL